MFGLAGFIYVYLVYVMHHCANGSCGAVVVAAGDLFRAGVLDDGTFITGPGRLCTALGLTRQDNGAAISSRLQLPESVPQYSTGPRVGLRAAADRPWRFWITGHKSVSRYTPAKPRVNPSRGVGES